MSPNKPLLTLALIVSAIFLLALIPLMLAFGKTGRNTTVLGKDYSLLKKSQIISRLPQDFPSQAQLNLTGPDLERNFPLSLTTIDFSVDVETTASQMLFRRIRHGLWNYFKAFSSPSEFKLAITYNQPKLSEYLRFVSSELNKPFVPHQLVLVDPARPDSLKVVPGQLGREVNETELQSQILARLESYDLSPLTIPLRPLGNLSSLDSANEVLAKAKILLGRQIILTADNRTETVSGSDLINWLAFDSACNNQVIMDFSTQFAKNFKKDPVDALLQFENNQVKDFRPSENGYTVNASTLASDLCPALTTLTTGDQKEIKLALPLTYINPKINNGDVNNLGIKELLGRGTSTFSHSTAIRNFNVERGAAIVNRVLVAPGDTFSFVKALGEVTLESGFKKAYIIRAGKTELDVGGGICQVSTTLFRAMLNSGLSITERRNHAYRVSYYEEDMPPGYDATVFIPSPDLKFVNDTPAHLLIQSTYDGKKKSLTYEIYGTSDGRITEISNYRKWGAAPPPPDVYIDDPTLPPGKVIQDEQRIPGLKTSFDWKVTRGEEILHQKTFTSSYTPWAAVFRRGPALTP
ncbi:MAG: VanW family protein [Candidatus Shapirobacteria bacterium]